jgi:transcriptional regulator with XRE-family HTH domain/predicted RNase H-like HicB family nuclease
MRFYALISRAGESLVAEFPDCRECVAVAGPSEDIGRNAAAVLRAWLEAQLLTGGVPPQPSPVIPSRTNARARGIEVPPLLALRIATRQARHQRGLDTAAFAETLGLPEQQLLKLEHPAGEPAERTIVRVTKELGLPYFLPSRREGATQPVQPDLFPQSRRGSIIRPFLSAAAYDVRAGNEDETVQLELTFNAPRALLDRMQSAAAASGENLSGWLLALARERLAAESDEAPEVSPQQTFAF